jgi:6-phosphogluconolactonase (cycloisomerase 2 family)
VSVEAFRSQCEAWFATHYTRRKQTARPKFSWGDGSDDVSLFDVTADGLELADVEAVGDRPVSVAVYRNLVYVLNQGGDSIQGIRITDEDTLVKITNSTRPLSGTGVNAAEVAFSRDGRFLAVTEKATAKIDTYVVRPNGRPVGPAVGASSGLTPFGFQFGPDGRLYVSEAPTSSASSYDVAADGTISVISASVPDGGGAACWLVVTSDGRFAYVANAQTSNVSLYGISSTGALSLINGAAGATTAGPVDEALTADDGFLYVLSSGTHTINGFAVNGTSGALSSIGGTDVGASGFAGIVAV